MNINISSGNVIKALGAMSVSSLVLLAFRIISTGEAFFLFLVWNLFLAWLPLIFALKLSKEAGSGKRKTVLFLLFFLWFIFFPNAPYIITDLLHLKPRHNFPLWFDIILITSFAWTGLLLGFASLMKIQKLFSLAYGKSAGWVLSCCVLFFSSFGIYLGRFQRWNSWDIFLSPLGLLSDIVQRLSGPVLLSKVYGVTLAFTLFLISSYFCLYVLTQNKTEEAK